MHDDFIQAFYNHYNWRYWPGLEIANDAFIMYMAGSEI